MKFWVLVRWTKVNGVSDSDQSRDDKVERVGSGTSVTRRRIPDSVEAD